MTERTHIGIFGKRNAGKSTLINMLTNQEVSIVSPVPGTTTDPVNKPIEINGLGACVFIDTAGYDDAGEVGAMRVTKTKQVLQRCDTAIFVIPSTIIGDKEEMQKAAEWYKMINERTEKSIVVINDFGDIDGDTAPDALKATAERFLQPGKDGAKSDIIVINALKKEGREEILKAIGHIKERAKESGIVTHLVNPGDVVLLVMPQDIQAPAGRLILPQVQTIRELLDNRCIVVSCTTSNFKETLKSLAAPPSLIITDSQAFKETYDNKPAESRLTSFSVLFAQWKGDINVFVEGAKAISQLNDNSRILIAEACSHAPLAEDIGREKIPALIHKKISDKIKIDIVSGNDWPENLDQYDLIIHCGACMISRQQVINRIKTVEKSNKKITNYGVCIAYFNNILDKIIW